MKLNSLSIKNFRNLKEAGLNGCQKVNIISGKNAQGKTNLLESVYFLSTLSADRVKTNSDLINFASGFFYLKGEAEIKSGIKTFEASLSAKKEFQVKIDGMPVAKKNDYIGEFKAVKFSPDDTEIIKGPPAARRKVLNILVSIINRAYLKGLSKYNHVLSQKNKLLEQINRRGADAGQLEIWNEQLVKEGAYLIEKRAAAADFINKSIGETQKEISRSAEAAGVVYKTSFDIGGGISGIEESFRKKLDETKREEIFKKMSLVGPHRDDLVFLINGNDARFFASEGQLKSIVTGLKLSEREFIIRETGEEPVMLVDDILFDLDSDRREDLMAVFSRFEQLFMIKTPDKDLKKYFVDSRAFEVHEGSVKYG